MRGKLFYQTDDIPIAFMIVNFMCSAYMSLGYCKRILRLLLTLYFQGDFQGFNYNLDTKILHAYRGNFAAFSCWEF